jgi:predicted Zn finger-like uncharacterized protein
VVVVCQKCRARFQLDGARIPAKGVRVRCSKCKHAFFVAPPATEDQAIHRLAEEAARTGRPGKVKPEPELDLPGPGHTDDELSSALSAAGAGSGEHEDDWEFNTPPREGGDFGGPSDATPPPAEITDSEPTESDAVDSFFELDGLRDPGPERGTAEPVAAKAKAGARPAPAPPSPPAKATPRKAAPPNAPIEPEQEVSFEDLGDPDSWDFGSEGARAEAAPAAKPATAARAAAPAKRKARESAPSEAVLEQSVARLEVPSPVGAAAAGAAWLLAFVLFAFGLRGAFAPPAAFAEIPAVALGSLELGALHVRHLENFWAGPVVVVAGELRNPGSAAASAGVVPRVRVTDAAGVALDLPAAWLGAEIPEPRLREDEPGILAAELLGSARRLAERSLAPGEAVPVQAVIAGLPAGALGFAVEGAPLAAAPEPTQPAAAPPPAEEPLPAEPPAEAAGAEPAAGAAPAP